MVVVGNLLAQSAVVKQSCIRSLAFTSTVVAAMMIGSTAASASEVCDLRFNSTCTAINGGLFYTNEIQPSGTGVVDSFLRIQMKGTEQGYNTSARPTEFNEQSNVGDPNYTTNLLLSDVSTKMI